MSDAYFKSCMCLSELAIESVYVDMTKTTKQKQNKQTNNQANTNKQENKSTRNTRLILII